MKAAGDAKHPDLVAGAAVLAFAAAMRLIFGILTGGTYDYDEFVYLLLGRAVARGGVPYHDFLFYHPPGILMMVVALHPLISHSWLWGRVVTGAIDCSTCLLTFLIARRLFDRDVAVIAGVLAATSPIMLITGTRILPDPFVGFFTLLAAYLLLVRPTWACTIVAGVCLGIAVLFKYPALLILPACLILAGRRRGVVFAAATAVTVGLLIIPLTPELHQFVTDTIFFQTGRNSQSILVRIGGVVLFLVLLQPLAVFGLFTRPRAPLWILASYLAGFAYVLSPQVYYHYMTPLVPFAGILGALYLTRLRLPKLRRALPAVTAIGGLGVMALWAAVIVFGGGQPLHLTAAPLSNVLTERQEIDRVVAPSQSILSDRPEIPYLSNRNDAEEYFWNDASVQDAQQLFPLLLKTHYVVQSFGPSAGYPPGFLDFISARYCRRLIGTHQLGGFLYNTGCTVPYLPPRQ